MGFPDRESSTALLDDSSGNILAWLASRRYRYAQPTAKYGLSPDGEGVVRFQISDGCA